VSADLTPENAALCAADPLNQLRLALNRDFTPSPRDIADVLVWYYDELVQAEEYGHHVLSREEAIRRANEHIDLAERALKQALIYQTKCRRGDWIASA
jgi:hypothetical protein